ncbi:MAG: rhomboid family intramembrane serine protease [Tenuifilaceae bacterium]|nr:rhomboid family intramembrane serine protease [Tenuifilaceae bacterium]
MATIEEKIFKHSLLLPSLFVLVLWLVTITEHSLGLSFYKLGTYPRSLAGLSGILFTPFIHSGFKHLLANSIPLIVMGSGIIYFYRSLSYRVFLIIWLASGICLWIGGRPSYHIGASGLVYGLASFLFFSGAIRRDPRLAAISLVIVFLYGGMIWGVFPIWPSISWEGHLFGGISGFACAIAYRHQGPQRKIYNWEIEDDEEEEISDDNQENQSQPLQHNENIN